MLILEAQKILTHTHISFFKPCAETKSRKLHLVQFLPLDICGFVWIRGQDFLLLATGAFLVPDHLYIYGFTLTWIQWMPSGMDMSRKKKGSLSLQLSHRPCVFRCHECIAALLHRCPVQGGGYAMDLNFALLVLPTLKSLQTTMRPT